MLYNSFMQQKNKNVKNALGPHESDARIQQNQTSRLEDSMPKKSEPLASAIVLLLISYFVSFIGLAMYAFSDVHNEYDYLLPIILIMQTIVVTFLNMGKRWALMVFTVFVVFLQMFILYYYRNDIAKAALPTLSATSIPLFIVIYIWIFRRDYFS